MKRLSYLAIGGFLLWFAWSYMQGVRDIDPDPVLGVLTAIAGAAFVWGAFRGSLS